MVNDINGRESEFTIGDSCQTLDAKFLARQWVLRIIYHGGWGDKQNKTLKVFNP